MKNSILSFAFLLLVLSSCSQRKGLAHTEWVLLEAYYGDYILSIESTDPLRMTNPDGFQTFTFSDDGKILLPGVGTVCVEATWNVIGDTVYFTADSLREGLLKVYNADLTFLDADADNPGIPDSIVQKVPGRVIEISRTMSVYRSPFLFEIVGDTLFLESAQTLLVAVKAQPPF